MALTERSLRRCVAEGSLGTTTGAGVAGSWKNPGGDTVEATLEIRIDTAAGNTCTMDAGQTAVSAVTSSDTLIDGLNMNQTGWFDNKVDHGTNGLQSVKVAPGEWITFSLSATRTPLVAKYYIWGKAVARN